MANDMLIEVFGDQGVSPLPVAVRSGDLVRGFRIVGTDPDTGVLGDGIDAQLRFAHEHMRRSIESAGGSRANIAHVSMYFQDFARDREAMNPPWVDAFPDESDRPDVQVPNGRPPPATCWCTWTISRCWDNSRQTLSVEGVAHTNPIPPRRADGTLPLLLTRAALRSDDGPAAGGRAVAGGAPLPQHGGASGDRRDGLEQRQAGTGHSSPTSRTCRWSRTGGRRSTRRPTRGQCCTTFATAAARCR